jgi:hypothetical protein
MIWVLDGLDGLKVGLGDGQNAGISKPKRKKRKNRRRNKKDAKENPLGPKPGSSLIRVTAGDKPERHEQRSFQVGES